MTREKVLIHGAGGFGREVAWLLSELSPPVAVEAFLDDDERLQGRTLNGIPVLGSAAHPTGGTRTIAIGSGGVREKVRSQHPDADYPTYVAPSVRMSGFVELGAGTIVCAGSILTVNIVVGEQVHINLDCTIGHDVVMEDFVTLAPGVHVSGNVVIGRGSYVGTGANIINGTTDTPLVIAPGTVVGAGACIIGSTEPDSLYVGVPAKRKK